MNKQTIALLKSSFAEIAKRRPDVAALFYKRLFEVAPAVKPMFKSSPKDQQRKLTAALAQIVASLEQPQKLSAHLTRMGERHVAYGAQPAHYKVVGEVLLWTFEQVLKRDFTQEVRAAWVIAYGAVSDAMIAAAKASASKPKTGARATAKQTSARKPAAKSASVAKAKSKAKAGSMSKVKSKSKGVQAPAPTPAVAKQELDAKTVVEVSAPKKASKKSKLKLVVDNSGTGRAQRTTRSGRSAAAEGGKRKAARRPARKPARVAKKGAR